MKKRAAIKTDLFAAATRKQKIDRLGDTLLAFESHINFAALAAEVDRVVPRPESLQFGRPPYPTETMVRILFLNRFNNLSDEQVEFQLRDESEMRAFS